MERYVHGIRKIVCSALGLQCVLEPGHPLPRGLQELLGLPERLLACRRHSTFSRQLLSKQIIMAQ